MGTYYTWANMTKKQYLNNVFKNGQKLLESCWYECPETNALCTLLATDWHGDVVAFLSDAGLHWNEIPEGDTRLKLRSYLHDYEPTEYVEDWFEDITGIFKDAQGQKGWVVEPPGPDGDYLEFDYTGPFDRDVIQYRYIVNETKREFYDRKNQYELTGIDPLPMLMGLVLNSLYFEPDNRDASGSWIGDIVIPSHTPPQDPGYKDVTGLYVHSDKTRKKLTLAKRQAVLC